MSKIKAFIPIVIMAAVFFLIPGMKLSATAATTYAVGYDSAKGQWMYEDGGTWRAADYHRELYYLKQFIKDGDVLVVYGEGKSNLELSVNVTLSNLTFLEAKPCVIYAKSITDCYVLKNSIVSVNGPVTNASVYNTATANFNNDIQNLNVLAEGAQSLYSNVSVAGAVSYVKGANEFQTLWQYYNVQAGKTSVVNGVWKTDAAYYSTNNVSTGGSSSASTGSSTAVTTSGDISAVFDPTYYAKRYPDLATAGITTDAQLKAHFLANGMKEGRQGNSVFNVNVYKANYPDLQKVYGEDLTCYYYHYINNGKAEGRNATTYR